MPLAASRAGVSASMSMASAPSVRPSIIRGRPSGRQSPAEGEDLLQPAKLGDAGIGRDPVLERILRPARRPAGSRVRAAPRAFWLRPRQKRVISKHVGAPRRIAGAEAREERVQDVRPCRRQQPRRAEMLTAPRRRRSDSRHARRRTGRSRYRPSSTGTSHLSRSTNTCLRASNIAWRRRLLRRLAALTADHDHVYLSSLSFDRAMFAAGR